MKVAHRAWPELASRVTALLAGSGRIRLLIGGPIQRIATVKLVGRSHDYTGSGVETIAHLRENGRICVMFASFDQRPRIVRPLGRGSIALPRQALFAEVADRHPYNSSTRA